MPAFSVTLRQASTAFGRTKRAVAVAVVIDKRTFTRELVATTRALQTIHHLGGGTFVRAGGTLSARPL